MVLSPHNNPLSDELVRLVYVSDQDNGIVRKRHGNSFRYLFNDRKVEDDAILERIRRLAIPPAWNNVWICRKANGHLQSTGIGARGRKQYRYHLEWQQRRNQSKYDQLQDFGKVLPKLRERMKYDSAKRSLTEEKVIATVLSLMEATAIRIGNGQYEKDNRSYGLTTLKDRHVAINGNTLRFTFTGKKGIVHRISLNDKRLARIVRQCRDIPGKELFRYYDEDGQSHPIDSGKVNAYIKAATNSDFTSKDLRTWTGTVQALEAFYRIGNGLSATEKKQNILAALDEVSDRLGNTRSVCQKYYVHPLLLELYESGKLDTTLLKPIKPETQGTGLTAVEKIVLKLLRRSP